MTNRNDTFEEKFKELILDVEGIKALSFDIYSLLRTTERVLKKIMIGLIEIHNRNNPNWQKEAIFKPDIELYNEAIKEKANASRGKHPTKCVLSAKKIEQLFKINYGEPIAENAADSVSPLDDLSKLDFAAISKLLGFRVKINPATVNFGKDCSKLRNGLHHFAEEEDEEINRENYGEILEIIKEVISKLNDIHTKNYDDEKYFSTLIYTGNEALKSIQCKLDALLNPKEIDPDSTPSVMPEDIVLSYKIIIDEFAATEEYGKRFINNLREYPTNILISAVSAKNLRQISNNKPDSEQGRNAKDVIKLIKDSKRKFRSISFNPPDSESNYGECSYKHILDFIAAQEITCRKICILTSNTAQANLIYKGTNNPNVIVIKAISGKEAVPYPKNVTTGTQNPHTHTSEPTTTKKLPSFNFVSGGCDYEEQEGGTQIYTTRRTEEAPVFNTNNQARPYIPQTKVAPEKFRMPFRMPKIGDSVYIEFPGCERIPVKINELKFSGGEGNLYSNDQYGSMLVKIYKPGKLDFKRIRKIQKMVEYSFKLSQSSFDFEKICWPEAIIYDTSGKYIIGYAMEMVKEAMTVETLVSKLQISENAESIPWNKREHLVKICSQIATRFHELHTALDSTVLMGDINAKNILVSDNNGEPCIHFIDVDSYQLDEENLCPVGTADFSSPRILREMEKGKKYPDIPRSKNDELFAMCVLFFYILSIKEFPFDVNEKLNIKDSIMQGQYSYYDHKEGEANAKKARRNNIYQNFSDEIKKLFVEVFRNQNYNFSDLDCSYCFNQMYNDIAQGKLSNELFPNCHLFLENDEFVKVECRKCSQEFESSVYETLCYSCKSNSEREGRIVACEKCQKAIEDYKKTKKPIKAQTNCQDCKMKITHQKSIIFKIKCSNCGCYFTANLFDLRTRKKVDAQNPKCPDCASFDFSKRNEVEDNFEEKIAENISFSFKNLNAWKRDNNG